MKKGFTIAEMLGVVIVLCIIAIIAFPPILNLIKETENDLDESTKQLVNTAATQYVTRHSSDFEKTIGNTKYIFIEDLIKEQFLSNNLIENSNLELDSCVKVNVTSELKYEYNVEVECSEKKGE